MRAMKNCVSSFVYVTLLVLLSAGQILEEEVLHDFSENAAYRFCPQSDNKCIAETIEQLRSVKLSEYYRSANLLNSGIDRAVDQRWDWRIALEGNSLGAFNKTALLARLADDARVQTICEVGFNAGYSTLTYLVANPNASILAFDIFEHNYTSLAVHQLHHMYPSRILSIIAGDSAVSVPNFHSLHPSFKCNLIFVDGGHRPHQLLTDLSNFRAFADPIYHRVVIDDLQDKALMQIFTDYATMHMTDVEFVEINPTLCILWQISSDGSRYEFDTRDEMCGTNSSVFRKGIVGVAKYS